MKKFLLLWMAITLTGGFSVVNAQSKSELSDKALSAKYKYEIDVLNSEIKTLKIKLKADQKNLKLRTELEEKEANLKDVKSKKKIMDDAIKSKAVAEKAEKKAGLAEKNAQRRADDAQLLREKEKEKRKFN